MLEPVIFLTGHIEDRVWHVSWSKNGKLISSCGEDKVVRIWFSSTNKWDSDSTSCIATLEDAQSRTIRCCEWSFDDEMIASASFDGTIVIWERQNNNFTVWQAIATLEGHENEVKCVSWSPNGKWLASCGRDKTVWSWKRIDKSEYECVSILQGKNGHTQDVKNITWHPKLPILFSASYDDTVKVWKEEQDEWYCVQTLCGHESTVWSLAIHSDGQRLVTCSDDRSLVMWEQIHEDPASQGSWKKIGALKDVHKQSIFR